MSRGIRRILTCKEYAVIGSQRKILRRFWKKRETINLLYCGDPPNDVALAAARYAEKKGIPFVVDVNDLLPVAMRMVLDIPVVSSVLFYPLQRDAEKVYGLTSGVIGTSDEYRDRPFLHQKREIPRETVYVGNDLADFDDGAEEYMAQVNKAEDEFWVTYAGTIGTSYDIRTMVLAAGELEKRGRSDIRFKILGGADL